jgi:hypothetical protein
MKTQQFQVKVGPCGPTWNLLRANSCLLLSRGSQVRILPGSPAQGLPPAAARLVPARVFVTPKSDPPITAEQATGAPASGGHQEDVENGADGRGERQAGQEAADVEVARLVACGGGEDGLEELHGRRCCADKVTLLGPASGISRAAGNPTATRPTPSRRRTPQAARHPPRRGYCRWHSRHRYACCGPPPRDGPHRKPILHQWARVSATAFVRSKDRAGAGFVPVAGPAWRAGTRNWHGSMSSDGPAYQQKRLAHRFSCPTKCRLRNKSTHSW